MITVWDVVSGLCQIGPKAMAGHHLLGIGQGYFIFKFCIRQTGCLGLHGQGRSFTANPHAHLASVGDRNQPIADLK
jgi:hypothetical protein